MQEGRKRLTFIEAASIVTGFGVGGGIMAVPYLASLTGIVPFLVIVLTSYGISVILHLMIAEIVMRDSAGSQLVELFGKYLFRGRGGTVFTWIFFILITIAFIANLSAYIAGSGEILRDLLAIPLWAGHFLSYAVAAGVVFFGLKAIGLSEKYSVAGMLFLVGALAVGSLLLPFKAIPFGTGGINASLALYGMVMFSFSAMFSVPQTAEGLSWNRKLVPWSIIVGTALNMLIVVVITVLATGVSGEVTKVAIIGWGQAIGKWAFIAGGLFVFLAMLTSYWSISFALAVIITERVGWGRRLSWLAATLPTFLVVIAGITDFLGFMRVAGGAIAILVALLVVPTLNGARRHGDVKNPGWSMGVWGNTVFQAAVIIAFIVMAVGSMVKID